jgi:hypothetical protein
MRSLGLGDDQTRNAQTMHRQPLNRKPRMQSNGHMTDWEEAA